MKNDGRHESPEIQKLQKRISDLERENKSLKDKTSAMLNMMEDLEHAKTRIEESEQKYSTVIETTDTGYVVLDFQGNVLDANLNYARLTGHATVEETLGRKVTEWTAPYDLERNRREVAHCVKTGFVRNLLVDYIHKDGTIVPIEINAKVQKTNKGMNIITLCRDITERKRTEEILRQSEDRFRNLFMSMSDGFYLSETIHDDNGEPSDYRYLEINPTFERTLGLSREQIIGKRYKELVPVDTTKWLDTYFEVARSGNPLLYEFYSPEYEMHFETYSYKTASNQVAVIVRDISERKRTTQALEKNNLHLTIALEGGNADSWEMDLAKESLTHSPRWAAHLGYGPGEISQTIQAVVAIIHPDDVAGNYKALNDYLDGKKDIYETECRLKKKNGDWLWILSRGTAVARDSQNRLTRLAGVNFDISERKKAEQALRESELKYRSLIENTSDVVFCVNEKGEYQFVNTVFAKTFDKTPDDFIGKTFWDVYSKEQADYRYQIINKVFETGLDQTSDVTVPLPDKTLYFIAKSNPIKDETGKVVLSLTISTNITERKIAEQQLRESEQKFRSIAEQMNEVIFITDSQGLINYLSPKTTDIFGLVPDEMIGHPFVDFLMPDDIEKAVTAFMLSVENNIPTKDIELRMKRKDGSWFYGELNGTMFQSGVLTGSLGVIRDVTPRKKAEETLREKERILTALLNGIPESALLMKPDGTVLAANTTVADRFKLKPNQLLGIDMFSKLPPETEANRRVVVEKAMRTKSMVRFEDERFGRIIDNCINPVLDAEDNVHALAIIGMDITERKKAEEELKQRLDELISWQTVTLSRETKVMELKKEVNELLKELGKPSRYQNPDE